MTQLRTATSLVLLTLTLTGWAGAADEPVQPSARERLRARVAEDARKAPVKSPATANAASSPTTSGADNPASPAASPAEPPAKNASAPSATAAGAATKGATVATTPAGQSSEATAKQAPTVLPKVEVKKSRITVLDHERAKQDIEIAREKKNLEGSEVDSALNDAKIARPLAIFGGDSTQFRKGVASERVQLMEAEKDLIEAIAFAKTKEEKAALQKQLNELKAMRRELDKSMR